MTTSLPLASTTQLPDIASARLPTFYEEARAALARCETIDECWEWADRMAALASYAKQAEDSALFNSSTRIRARAVRRAGEILQDIEPQRGANQNIRGDDSPKVLTRKAAGDAAGLSDDQRKTALRVANVPGEQFESQVEAANPPSVTALAEQGTAKQTPTVTPVAQSALRLWGRLRDFEREGWLNEDPAHVMATLTQDMKDDVHRLAPRVAAWLRLIGAIPHDERSAPTD